MKALLRAADMKALLKTAAWDMAGYQSNSRPQILVFVFPDKDSTIYGRSLDGNLSNSCPQILVFILPDKDSIIYGRSLPLRQLRCCP